MNQPKRRLPNWIVGVVLALIFVGIFLIAILGFALGFEAAPPIKKIVAWITTIIAGAIGIFLIGAAIIDVVKAFVKKRLSK